jgi:ankyrin repeat protein
VQTHGFSENRYTEIVRLLLQHGADPNLREETYNETALFKALFKGFIEISEMLIEYNADAKAHIKNNETCLMWSCFEGHTAIAKVLLDKGADMDAEDSKSAYGGITKRF